ncbi:MAG: hypothetical protein WC022_00580 [Parcubacteria group bacterium]
MISKFYNIAIAQIGSRGAEMNKNVYNYQNIIKDIEKELDRKIINVDEAMKRLHGRFSYHLTGDDYQKIEKEVRYNVK